MAKITATVVGLLVAPLVSAVIGVTQIELFGDLDIFTFLGLLPIFYIFSALATLLFGVPIFLIFQRLNLITCWTALASGLLIGAIVAIILATPNAVNLRALVTMSSMGATSAFVFWLIWSLGNKPRRNV